MIPEGLAFSVLFNVDSVLKLAFCIFYVFIFWYSVLLYGTITLGLDDYYWAFNLLGELSDAEKPSAKRKKKWPGTVIIRRNPLQLEGYLA